MKLSFMDRNVFNFGRSPTGSASISQARNARVTPRYREGIPSIRPGSSCNGVRSLPSTTSTPSSKESLEFRDEGSFFANPHASTVTIPDAAYAIPEARNGTIRTETANLLRSPKKAVDNLGRVAHRQIASLDWRNFRTKLRDLAELISESASEKLNQAMQGQDALRMLYILQDLAPSVSLPTQHKVYRLIDDLSDAVQKLFERREDGAGVEVEDEERQNFRWEFAQYMGNKAKTALVKQGIRQQWQVDANRENMEWQTRMHHRLAELFGRVESEYKFSALLAMKPVWIGIREKKVWRLRLDTGVANLEVVDGKPVDLVVELDTGFELSEVGGAVSVRDYTRTSKTIESGEFEDVESLRSWD